MYQALTFYHSILRWLVLVSLAATIYRAYRGWVSAKPFTKKDNAYRHWTATIAHIQLLVGMILYFRSPLVAYFRGHFRTAIHEMDAAFFGLIHPLLMLAAIIVLTIGSSLAKRRFSDSGKFRTMLIWYGAALVIILISIPWPFSPLAHRPYYR